MPVPQDPFEIWKAGRREIQPPPDFSVRVMARISLREIPNTVGLTEGFFSGLSAVERGLRLLLAFGLSAAGLFRISYVAFNLLIP